MAKKQQLGITDIPGVGAATADKLIAAGYDDLLSIAVSSIGQLVEASGVSEAVARKMIQFARDGLDMGFQSGTDILKKRDAVIKIKTGSKAFDDMMYGGFETGAITECFGQYGSGKCISKDTTIFYFNPETVHLESIEKTYEKYKNMNGEKKHEEGFVIETPTISVMGLTEDGMKRTKASHLYKEKVDKLVSISTKRGRKIKVTGPHKLLVFDDGMKWKPASMIQPGDLVAYPKELDFSTSSDLTEEDGYFLGFFAAEGSANPFSVSTTSYKVVSELKEYLSSRFGYDATIREDKRREKTVYGLLLRNETRKIMFGLDETNSASKFVPENVLSSDLSVVRSFLAGYFDGDAEVADNILSATTKSKKLAEGVSYLLSRIGISCTAKQRTIKESEFQVISVVGDDREKLNDLPFRLKMPNYVSRNSAYGYSGKIISFLQKTYKETLGSNRGRMQKSVGKKNHGSSTFYAYLASNSNNKRAMSEDTAKKIFDVFTKGVEDMNSSLIKVKEMRGTPEEVQYLSKQISFPLNYISKKLGMSKSSAQNFISRGIPEERLEDFKFAVEKELLDRIAKLDEALKIMVNFVKLNWDEVKSTEWVIYNDYVYDFVVPEGHTFVGGSMPTIMHNTQIGHILAVSVQKDDPEAVAVYIDTENTFRPERIKQFAEGLDLDPAVALENIRVARAFNSDHQMLLAEKVEELVKEGLKVRVVIVDSLTAHFRAEFVGRGTLAERQQKINKHMHTLALIADKYNICIYVTNQVMAKPDAFFGDPTEAIGGHIVGHNSTFRIYLRRGKKNTRVAKLVDSPNLPDAECAFSVGEFKLEDV